MKKTKRILAIIGVVLLATLYISTLVFAITDNTATMGYFKASVAATILVPVLLWAYTMIYKLTRPKDHDSMDTHLEDDQQMNDQLVNSQPEDTQH